MKPYLFVLAPMFFVFALVPGCLEEGREGSGALDCGDHGTAHAGHCDCDGGSLWDGATCALPEAIEEICGEEEEEEHEDVEDHEEEREHGACRCPDQGPCPCDHGDVQTFSSADFCVPELHQD